MTRQRTISAEPPAVPAVTALLVAAFLSPGAWLLIRLPEPPVAQAMHLAVAAAWVSLPVWGGRNLGDLAPRLREGVFGVLLAVAVALIFNPFPAQQLLYDLYAEMPALLWLAYPAVFLVAARLRHGPAVHKGLSAVLAAGGVLILVMVLWRFSQGFVTTFGSPAYSVPAFAPLPFVALGLAAASTRRRVAYIAVAVVAVAGLAYAAAGLSALYAMGMGVLVAATFAPTLFGIGDRGARAVRWAGGVLLALALAATLLAQVPSVTGRFVDLEEARSGEQTVATRLHLWDAAGSMFAERPVFGYGPGGYRFSAVEFYDAGVFPYISAIGSDPIAYSAPSPHSVLWEALTRLGLVGLAALAVLFAAWAKAVADRVAAHPQERGVRLGLAIGFCAYLCAVLVTPVHFASGLFGVVAAGLAVGPSGAQSSGAEVARERWPWVRVLLGVALLSYGMWLMVGLTAGRITGQGTLAEDTERVESAARIIPGEPLNERRRLEVALWATSDPGELAAVRARVDAAPGYVTGFAPNLIQFAFIGMAQGTRLGETDYSWERSLLERAAEDLPLLPSLVAEELHLAILEGDTAALPELMVRAEEYGMTYPRTAEYIIAAQELLAQ